jgi:hypothetical protein
VLGLSRVRKATPLRFGSGFHHGLELHNAGLEAEVAVQKAADYSVCPDWAEPTAWSVEGETLRALLSGHFWRYSQDDLRFLAAEQTFEMPLIHPATGAVKRHCCLAGKFDAIVQLPDGRLAVLEYKTAGEDIGPDSPYWLRLRWDGQISLYILAARSLGYDVAAVLYDVTRKPTIRLRQKERPEEYGKRLLADVGERPDHYYQRRELPCLEDQLAEFQVELWQQAEHLAEVERRGWWFRNVSALTCRSCPFHEFCLAGVTVEPGGAPPAGFEFLADVHPELAHEPEEA